MEFQDVMLDFCGILVKQVNRLQEDSRLTTAVVNCINGFLLKFGLDNFSRVTHLHTSELNHQFLTQ